MYQLKAAIGAPTRGLIIRLFGVGIRVLNKIEIKSPEVAAKNN